MGIFELTQNQIDDVSDGFVCSGLCVLRAIVAGAGIFTTGLSIG